VGEFSRVEYQLRMAKLRRVLAERGAAVTVLSQNADIYYYTGSTQPLYVIIPAQGEPFLLARKALARIREECLEFELEPFLSTNDLSTIMTRRGIKKVERLGLTCDTITYASALRWQQLFPDAVIIDLAWEIRELRMVKSPAEIDIMIRGGRIMADIPGLVQSAFQPGMTELELSASIELLLRRSGHTSLVRCRREGIEIGCGVCSAGTNALAGTKFDGICGGVGLTPAAPFGATRDPIAKGVPVILDYALNFEGYHIDQTRMLSWGEPAPEVAAAYEAMRQVQRVTWNHMKAGAIWGEIYDRAFQFAGELGYAESFMGFGPERVKFIGHGLGLELDEPPYLAAKMTQALEDGMVIATEPKVALEGIGVIGIEDTVLVRPNGCERLTTAPEEWIMAE
jgi:Xaa-Pro dipeptidase